MYHDVDVFASSIGDLQLPLVGLASKCWGVSIKCVVAGMKISCSFLSKGKRRQEMNWGTTGSDAGTAVLWVVTEGVVERSFLKSVWFA